MNETHEKEALTRELHDRSHDIGGHPIGLADVKQSARKIQRRRRIATGMVAAAVLAVAVPTSIAVTDGMTSTFQPPQPAQQPPAASDTPTPRPDGTFVLTTVGLERGEDPQVPYLTGSRLVTPEGTVDFPVTLQQVVPRGELWVGLGYDGRGAELFTFEADGQITNREPSGETFVVSDGGTRLAYVRTEEPWVQELRNVPNTPDYTDEAMGWDLRDYEAATPVGFLDDRTVVFETYGEAPFMGLGLPEGEIQPIEGFLNLAATSQASGLVSGQISYDPLDGSCSGVMDPSSSTTEMVWETCDYSLGRFSPNGQFVIGGTPDADGMGSPSLAILDARTGEPVVEFRPDRDRALAVNQVVWEDNDSVLAIILDGAKWRMVRASVSGALEAASDERSGPDMDIPYWFAEVPRV